MHKKIIAVTRHMPGVIETISRYGEVRSAPFDAALDKASLIALMSDADAVLTTSWDIIDAEMISACPKLRLICNMGVGYNNIDIAAARLQKIMVTNTPSVTDDAVADLAMGLMIAAARRLPKADGFVRSGQWTKATLTCFGLGKTFPGKHWGLSALDGSDKRWPSGRTASIWLYFITLAVRFLRKLSPSIRHAIAPWITYC